MHLHSVARSSHAGVLYRCLLAVAAISVAGTAAGQKTDVAVFKNGDRLTGEIKSLDRGKISFDNDSTGVISIEWDDIDRLISSTTFEVALTSGERLYGTLADAASDDEIRLTTAEGARDLQTTVVVGMTPIKSTIIDRIDMKVDLSYSLAKANDLRQTTLGYDFSYREEKRQIAFSFDNSTASSEAEPESSRVLGSLSYRRFLDELDWDPFGLGQYESNDELGIDRRVSFGGGMGRWLRDTNQSRIGFGGGVVRTLEDDVGSTETRDDTEALVYMDLEWFRYDDPELDVSTNLSLYRRLSGSHEPRGNLDVSFRWEIFKDFFWGLSFYYTFDQQTDNQEATTDYGTTVSLGWKL